MLTSQSSNVVMFMFKGSVFVLLPLSLLPPNLNRPFPEYLYDSGILRVVQIVGNFKKRVTWKTAERIMWCHRSKVREYPFPYLCSQFPSLKTLLDEAYEKISVFIPAYKKPSPCNS